jgi:hypothetical protein
MATSNADLGFNRTGVDLARDRADAMLEATQEFRVPATTDGSAIAEVRDAYSREVDPMGSVPPPATLSGTIKAAKDALLGRRPAQLIDKLGERLAFERTGARLYEVILGKLERQSAFSGGPTAAEVQRIILQESAHFRLLEDIIRRLGGDPTVVTPSANLHGTMTAGIISVVVDPRTTLEQCLEAALLAELADNEGWETLFAFLDDAGRTDLTENVAMAIDDEVVHLAQVRRWLAAAQERVPPGVVPEL